MGLFGGKQSRDDGGVSRTDLRRSEDRILREQRRSGATKREIAGKGARMVGRGINDIAKSMSQNTSRGRPRIAQLPRLRDMDIVQMPNTDKMKMKGLRNRDIRGRRID